MPTAAPSLLQRRGVRQLVKFSLVGASSTVIDKGTLWLLLRDVLPRAPWWVCATLSFMLAVTNGFVWNRGWTFRAQGQARLRRQYSMFVTTNVVSLGLNLLFTKIFLVAVTGELLHRAARPDATDVLLASLAAIPFVTLWNFAASKYWTFRAPTA
jgi:putative flippase GtrA